MAKPLVIVESKAKAKTIEGFLGRDRYIVMASIGHIRDLPHGAKQVPKSVTKPEVRRLGIDVDDHFAPIYVVPDDKKHVVAELKAALKDASELYLATDEDREGEAISWHLLEVLKPNVPVKRMVFHEITSEAIADAIDNWRDLDMKLVEAQEGRRVLDRLVGYEVSNVAFRRIGPGTSAGRVQSVATRLVVDRERARMAFRSATYWDLEGTFRRRARATAAAVPGDARLARRQAPRVGARLRSRHRRARRQCRRRAARRRWRGRARRSPRRPSVRRRVGRSARAQRAAEGTVHHLDAAAGGGAQARLQRGARDARRAGALRARAHHLHAHRLHVALRTRRSRAARSQIRRMYGDDYLPDQPRTYRSKVKNAQEAHEAIRPAGDRMRTADDLQRELQGSDECRLYDLIWKRTVATQMADARIRRVTLRLAATSTAGEEVVFQASGRTIEFPGYLRAYVEGADDPDAELEDREAILPPLDEGQRVDCTELRPSGHTTQPPARYTEASLVKELEERGIGRPSTYASVIDTIVNKRDYVWKKGTALVPTWTAFAKVQLLERYFAHLIDYEFTATMEEALDSIARGEGEAEKWLHSFYFGNGQVGPAGARRRRARGHDRQGRGQHGARRARRRRARAHRARVAERRQHRARRRQGADPRRPRARRAHARAGGGAPGARQWSARACSAPIPTPSSPVLALTGRFGPFVQLGEHAEGSKEKPKRASLFATMDPSTITLDEALALLSLPRVVGVSPEGEEITAQNGRYGPYLKKGTDSRSLESEDQLFTVTLAEAEALFAQPKRGAVAWRSRRSPISARTRSRARRSGCSTAASARTSPTAP